MFSLENILDEKKYVWNQRRDEASPRNLKRVRYSDGSLSKPETESSDDGVKKRKKMVDDKVGPALALPDVSEEGPSTIKACNQSRNSEEDPFGALVSEGLQERKTLSPDEQKALHRSLQVEMTRLCQVLKFTDAVTDTVLRILDYVIKNCDVNSRSQSVVHALQISLCWIASSITKTKIDKKDSLRLAKQLLNYQCTEEQAHSVYLILKEMENIVDSGRYCSLAEEGTPKVKSVVTDTGNGILKLKKNVKKRMKRLVQKHQEKRQELIRNWEEERVKLVMDHTVESAFVRSVHGQSLVGINKLKILNDDLDAKTSELNLQKGMELKNLETRQSADIAEEESKTAQWLADAKPYSSRPMTVNGLESLGPQPKEQVIEGHQPSETHVEKSVTVSSQNEPGVLSLATTGHVNKLKNSSNGDEAILANPPGSVEPVPDEVERNASEKVSDKGLKSDSPDEVVSIRDLQSPINASLRSEETTDCCDLSPQKGLNELAVEKPSTLQTEAEAIDTLCPVPFNHEALVTKETVTPGLSTNEAPVTDANVTPLLSNNGSLVNEKTTTHVQSINEALVTDETITSVPSNREVPVTENSGLLSCNTTPATEENCLERSSPQTTEPRGTEVLSHESIPPSREILDVHINHPTNTESMSSGAQEQSAELSAPSQNNVRIQSQVVMSTAERPNQVVLQPEFDPSYLDFLPSHQLTSGSLQPSLLADPLKIELENLRREAEQLENNQKNLNSQLRSDCQKEIQETIAQIRKKYELKLQEGVTGYQLKKQELDKNQKKVHMNKILAAVFRSLCSDPELDGLPVTQQVAPSRFVPQTHQRPMPPSVGPAPGLAPSQPAATSLPTTQQPHPSRAHSVSRSPAFINQNTPTVRSPTFVNQSTTAVRSTTNTTTGNRNVPPPPVQTVQNMAALFSSTPPPLPRPPPLIGTITPSSNPRPAGEFRSAAPHLQSFRPPAAAATSAPAPHLRAPHRLPSQALPFPPLTNFRVPQNRAGVVQQAAPTNTRPYVAAAQNRSTFGSLKPSDSATLGSNVVCLSDDDD